MAAAVGKTGQRKPCTVTAWSTPGTHSRHYIDTFDELQGVAVKEVPTKPIDGQKTGTSGLRKKTKASKIMFGKWVRF